MSSQTPNAEAPTAAKTDQQVQKSTTKHSPDPELHENRKTYTTIMLALCFDALETPLTISDEDACDPDRETPYTFSEKMEDAEELYYEYFDTDTPHEYFITVKQREEWESQDWIDYYVKVALFWGISEDEVMTTDYDTESANDEDEGCIKKRRNMLEHGVIMVRVKQAAS